jgi:hypothetical protein
MTWGLFLNTGIIAGSFIGAMLSGDFHFRHPRQGRVYIRVLAGGIFMGYGSGLASACAIGGFFSAVPSLGLNGAAFGAAMLAGALLGLQLIKRVG